MPLQCGTVGGVAQGFSQGNARGRNPVPKLSWQSERCLPQTTFSYSGLQVESGCASCVAGQRDCGHSNRPIQSDLGSWEGSSRLVLNLYLHSKHTDFIYIACYKSIKIAVFHKDVCIHTLHKSEGTECPEEDYYHNVVLGDLGV